MAPFGRHGLKIMDKVPAGFVLMKEFCERTHLALETVRGGVAAGRYQPENVVWVRVGNVEKLAIHWESEGVHRLADWESGIPRGGRGAKKSAAALRKEQEDAPPGLDLTGIDPRKLKKGPALPVLEKDPPPPSTKTGNLHGSNAPTEGEGDRPVNHLARAKLRREQLAVERAELDLQVARNQLIAVGDVEELLASVAVEVRQSVISLAPRLGPLLAAMTDPAEVTEALDRELRATLEALQRIERYATAQN